MAPGTAGSSLRATYAAGELLDWIDVNSVEQEDVFRWIDENVPLESSAELARTWAAVLTEAEASCGAMRRPMTHWMTRAIP